MTVNKSDELTPRISISCEVRVYRGQIRRCSGNDAVDAEAELVFQVIQKQGGASGRLIGVTIIGI